MDEDSEVIDNLRKYGANLSLPREVTHYLHLPSHEIAEWLAGELPKFGYHARLLKPDPAHQSTNPRTVTAASEMVVTIESITAASQVLKQLVGALHGDYDGWEAPVQP